MTRQFHRLIEGCGRHGAGPDFRVPAHNDLSRVGFDLRRHPLWFARHLPSLPAQEIRCAAALAQRNDAIGRIQSGARFHPTSVEYLLDGCKEMAKRPEGSMRYPHTAKR